MATLSWPAKAPKIIRQRSATCCGVPYEDSHFSNCARSAGSNWIARLVFGMREIIATTGKSVKLFKGHYTRYTQQYARDTRIRSCDHRNAGVMDCFDVPPHVPDHLFRLYAQSRSDLFQYRGLTEQGVRGRGYAATVIKLGQLCNPCCSSRHILSTRAGRH